MNRIQLQTQMKTQHNTASSYSRSAESLSSLSVLFRSTGKDQPMSRDVSLRIILKRSPQ